MKIMKCECCGKTFYTEYWQGNYIDHVENFAQHREAFAHSCNVKDMAKKIVFNGADFREEWCIKEFIKCFMKWDCFSEDFKQRVKQIVDATLLNIKKAKRTAERLEKKTSPIVLAMIREEDIDGAYLDLFDECCEEAKQ